MDLVMSPLNIQADELIIALEGHDARQPFFPNLRQHWFRLQAAALVKIATG